MTCEVFVFHLLVHFLVCALFGSLSRLTSAQPVNGRSVMIDLYFWFLRMMDKKGLTERGCPVVKCAPTECPQTPPSHKEKQSGELNQTS